DAKSCGVEQVAPSLPHVEVQMRAVEKALVILRKAAGEDGQPEIEIAAVGQGGHQPSIGFENSADLRQHAGGIAQGLDDIAADHVVEPSGEGRKSTIEVRLDECAVLGKSVAMAAGALDADDFISAPGQDFGKIAGGASDVEDSFAAALGRERVEQDCMAAV